MDDYERGYRDGQRAEREALKRFCEAGLAKLEQIHPPRGGAYEQAMVAGKAAAEQSMRNMIEWVEKREKAGAED
jgi:hypothetical protein